MSWFPVQPLMEVSLYHSMNSRDFATLSMMGTRFVPTSPPSSGSVISDGCGMISAPAKAWRMSCSDGSPRKWKLFPFHHPTACMDRHEAISSMPQHE
jgi:hypothetical protein